MKKRFFELLIAFTGLVAGIASALYSNSVDREPNEVERLKRKVIAKAQDEGAVILLPNPNYHNQRFIWLAAHGSHVSHASHASHASHVSGTYHRSGSSCSVFTPLSKDLYVDAIPGFKEARLIGQKNAPLLLHFPTSTIGYPSIKYILNTPPSNGMVTIDAEGTVIYIPNPGFEGDDSFSILATDDITSTEPILLSVAVQDTVHEEYIL